ncbi:hypothetical protein [uncultured Tateyamaria sp.]|uniref:hypothetical protein n=1 Tax=uncultured Tateyamaria sp. TaxID=455651 RepID=UPI00262D32F9|nr:hypothetical protein [uncultured Tateyamaria sp.]
MRHLILCLFLCAPTALLAQAKCLATPLVADNTRLAQISDIWFGDSSFRYAILLATNVRTSDPRFNYISDINNLPKGGSVCVPQIDEALRFKTRYDRYIKAVQDMAVAHDFEVVQDLVPLPSAGTYQVATWVRPSEVSGYPEGQEVTLGKDVWVTLSPHLQTFCTDYAKTVAGDPRALSLRVEQRLGLPPGTTKTHFVTFDIDANTAGRDIFRPCAVSATHTTTCPAGAPKVCSPGDTACHAHRDFFFQQYYTAFGTEHPIEYPWTSLGYTFDWAPAPIGFSNEIGYIRTGESEYVIPSGTSVTVASVTPTGQYCGK